MKMRRVAAFSKTIVGCLMLAAASARADDSYVDGVSGTVRAMKPHKTIRMVSERVDMWLPKGEVKARFVFKNDGPATVVTMGFPEGGTFPIRDHKLTAFRRFRSTVDGKPVLVKRMVGKADQGYQYWWVKKVRFARGQTRKVVCEYAADPDDMGDYLSFTYRLDTGASWKGNIGEAVVVAHFANWAAQTIDSVTPEPSSQTADTIEWRRKDFKPAAGDDWAFIDVMWETMSPKPKKQQPFT